MSKKNLSTSATRFSWGSVVDLVSRLVAQMLVQIFSFRSLKGEDTCYCGLGFRVIFCPGHREYDKIKPYLFGKLASYKTATFPDILLEPSVGLNHQHLQLIQAIRFHCIHHQLQSTNFPGSMNPVGKKRNCKHIHQTKRKKKFNRT